MTETTRWIGVEAIRRELDFFAESIGAPFKNRGRKVAALYTGRRVRGLRSNC